jgi:hypothetical protein
VAIPGAPTGAFVVQLSQPTLERMGKGAYGRNAWVVFTTSTPTDFASESDKVPRLLVHKEGAFNATKQRWTFGLPSLRPGKVRVLYLSYVAPRSEMARVEDVEVIGRAYGVFVDGGLHLVGGA